MCANGGKCNSQTGECTCAPGMQSDSALLYTNQLFVVICMPSEGKKSLLMAQDKKGQMLSA